MERKIGEIFERNGEWYQCVEGHMCYCCDLERLVRCSVTACAGGERSDSKGVHFKKLEKVGEPYKFQKRIIQTYKLYTEPFISPNMYFIWSYLKGSNLIYIIIKQTKEDMEEKNDGNTPLNVLTDKYINGYICYGDFEKEVKALYSCKEEIKPTLKEFDLETAKVGKPVCTRDGRKARIVCFDKKCLDKQILIVLVDCGKEESIYFYTTDGKCIDDFSSFDLMMPPEKKEGWVNVYKDSVYDTKDEALIGRSKSIGYIDTIKIEWEE